jgi:hypothetical protein
MHRVFRFAELATANLIVDAVYEGGSAGNASDDPIAKLLPGVGNQGGFRAAGKGGAASFIVLYTSGEDGDWPDTLDPNTGQFIYFGDNKTPGHELHDTSRRGNAILRDVFQRLHDPQSRSSIPPFLVFQKFPTERSSRSVQFKGLAAPGYPGVPMTEDLVAVWKVTGGQRFQNYRAMFTVLDVAEVQRSWLQAVGRDEVASAPPKWSKWVKTGGYSPLAAEPTRTIRTLEEQAPSTVLDRELLAAIWQHFKDAPIAFESFAAHVYKMTDARVIVDEVTRAAVDGGRDAMGRYLLGLPSDPVYAEFSLEAKCYRPDLGDGNPSTVGVREVSRLISRLRHRQFGVLVTTSAIARQAYQEVREDKHPIVFISGRDIVRTLIQAGHNSVERVRSLLACWPLT